MQFWQATPFFSTPANRNILNFPTPSIPIQTIPQTTAPSQFYPFFKMPSQFYDELDDQQKFKQNNKANTIIQPKIENIESADKLIGHKIKTPQLSKTNRNIKANILKDFIRSIKKDASPILLAKKSIGSDFSINEFMRITQGQISQNKYIRFKTIQNLCTKQQNRQFSRIFRTTFKNFVKNDYKIVVLTKKKNKKQYLTNLREMQQKMLEKAVNEDD